jgi:hypothetical protein
MAERTRDVASIIMKDPAVQSMTSFVVLREKAFRDHHPQQDGQHQGTERDR